MSDIGIWLAVCCAILAGTTVEIVSRVVPPHECPVLAPHECLVPEPHECPVLVPDYRAVPVQAVNPGSQGGVQATLHYDDKGEFWYLDMLSDVEAMPVIQYLDACTNQPVWILLPEED